ncbi:MAG TPA: [LysW]-aminoadipate kinase [Ignavibacteria bacterium]|nr:[LysW]-aminoadipate kinase [Ignavibacteria bacterium]
MIIVKIGGGKEINTEGIIKDLSKCGEKFIIIHGANYVRDELAVQLGKTKKTITSVSGYTSVFSDETAIDLMMMAYSGLKNKRIVELCQQNGINAVGLSGLDGKVISGKRNQGIRSKEDGKVKIVRDFSGKPKEINSDLLNLLMDNGYTPVLCVPIIDENNFAINSENDDIVNVLQSALKAEKIIQMIEAPGFLDDKDDPDSLIKNLTKSELFEKEEKTEGRMKRKMHALRKLFEEGAAEVYISDGRTEHPFDDAVLGKGTLIK